MVHRKEVEKKALFLLNKKNAIVPVATLANDGPKSFQVAGRDKTPYTVTIKKGFKVGISINK